METLILIISVLLIAIVLLQAGKSEGASNILTGGNDSLFSNRKERGGELFVTRLTAFLAASYIIVSLISGL